MISREAPMSKVKVQSVLPFIGKKAVKIDIKRTFGTNCLIDKIFSPLVFFCFVVQCVVFCKKIDYNQAQWVEECFRHLVTFLFHPLLFQNGGINYVKHARHCKGSIAHR